MPVNRRKTCVSNVEAMIHLPFEDRLEAGRLLAQEIAARQSMPDRERVVLGLARGGVPVGFSIAARLAIPLDVIIVRKLGVPWQPELAMGAIAKGVRLLDDRTVRHLGIFPEEIDSILAREESELQRREAHYRGGQPPTDLRGREVILVDDGLATGSTMLAAVRAARAGQPARIVVAVPVGSQEACRRIGSEADDLVCLATPELFHAVGEWYRVFDQVTDADVKQLLAESRQMLVKQTPAV